MNQENNEMDFNLNEIQTVEFGVGRDDGDEHAFHCVMVDPNVQTALGEMATFTHDLMLQESDESTLYTASEKYASSERIHIPLDDDLAIRLRNLHKAENLDVDQKALDHMDDVFCYFARFTDQNGRRLTALRRASHFKGILQSRLIQWVNDSMRLIDDNIFKLDKDFDLLIDSQTVHILHPSGFEFAGKLQGAILEAVEGNVQALQQDLPIVNFDRILAYASKRPRAARYIASIKSQQEIARVDMQHLLVACRSTSVEVLEENGQIIVSEGHEMGLLEVLDRRRYEVRLVPDEPEQFRAASRKQIQK